MVRGDIYLSLKKLCELQAANGMRRINVGIDISKGIHTVAIVDENREQIGRTRKITDTKRSVERLKSEVDSIAEERNAVVTVATEAAGVYGFPLISELSKHYDVKVYNPLQLKGVPRRKIRKTKTDRIDSIKLANAVNDGLFSHTNYDERERLEIRELNRYRIKLVQISANLKKRVRRNISLLFPGYERVFKSVFAKSSKAILKKYPTPDMVQRAGERKIAELLRRFLPPKKAVRKSSELVQLAREVISSEIIMEACMLEMRLLLDEIEVLEKHAGSLEKEIKARWKKLNPSTVIATIPLREIHVIGLYCEIGDAGRFDNSDQLIAYAGLDPIVYQSGGKEVIGPLSKCGSSTLRYITCLAADQLRRRDGAFKEFFIKKRVTDGKKYNIARCRCAKKLLRVIYKLEKSKQSFSM